MEPIQPSDLLSVREFAERFPNLGTEGSLRWQIFHESLNGLTEAGAIVRRGSRVFLVVPRYTAWLLDQRKQAA